MTDIKIEQLTKDYGQGRGVFDVNLNIQRGEMVAVKRRPSDK